ncbi:hypothetical protein RSX24_030525 [Paenibacillus sp. ES5-4]
MSITILVNQMFNHELIEAEDVVQDHLRGMYIEEIKIQGSINSSKGYDETLHHNPLDEKKLLTFVKEGKLDRLKHFTQLGHENTGVLSKSSHIQTTVISKLHTKKLPNTPVLAQTIFLYYLKKKLVFPLMNIFNRSKLRKLNI